MKKTSHTPPKDAEKSEGGNSNADKSKKTVKTNENTENKQEQESTLTVKVVSNWSLLEILGDWTRVWKILFALIIVTITIFLGLAIVTISLKRAYPYNDIKINMFGATTLQNENTEVNYWLFNTADLWANSGIHVEKGDRLTIRASGKFHTAIHHLNKETSENKKLTDGWVDTDGYRGSEEPKNRRDIGRMKYRIFPSQRQDALLMQVVPEKHEDFFLKGRERDKYSEKIDEFLVFKEEFLPKTIKEIDKEKRRQREENFYLIGKEREDLMIYEDGVLHFAVNDIVLTHSIIDSLNRLSEEEWTAMEFKSKDDPKKGGTQCNSELDYYKKHNYYNAWFDDNVGSFLIVIERKK
jgi:hypothetical protein